MEDNKRAYAVWYKVAEWPKDHYRTYVWAENEHEAKKAAAKILKTKVSNVNVLEKPIDFKTPFSYPS